MHCFKFYIKKKYFMTKHNNLSYLFWENLGLEKMCSGEIFRAKTFSAPLILSTYICKDIISLSIIVISRSSVGMANWNWVSWPPWLDYKESRKVPWSPISFWLDSVYALLIFDILLNQLSFPAYSFGYEICWKMLINECGLW